MRYTKEKLMEEKNLEFLPFWSHKNTNPISATCFSQWYPSEFKDNNKVLFKNAEQYMMFMKATIFQNFTIADKILETTDPKIIKQLGREVKGFESQVWDRCKFEVVVSGNYFKFSQNEELRNFLLSTGDKILVEASPLDLVWGIGFAPQDKEVNDVSKWKGENLLGFALMEVRDLLVKYKNK